MMAFAKTLEEKWTALGLSKSQFEHKDNPPRLTGKLVIHQPGIFSSGNIFNLLCLLYVDDGAFIFESRTDIERRITLLSNHFSSFGLKIHFGT